MVGGIVETTRDYRSGRLFALGSIHGHIRPLRALVRALQLEPRDTLVVLGDMIDHGPDSRAVIALLMNLREKTRVIHLLGDHEDHLLRVVAGQAPLADWLARGGRETLDSYRVETPASLPADHLEFLQDARLTYSQGNHLFAHGGYLPHWPLPYTPRDILLGQTENLSDRPHHSGNTVVMGHSQNLGLRAEAPSSDVLDLGFMVSLETNCHQGAWLTALDLRQPKIIQANRRGRVRRRCSYVRF